MKEKLRRNTNQKKYGSNYVGPATVQEDKQSSQKNYKKYSQTI